MKYFFLLILLAATASNGFTQTTPASTASNAPDILPGHGAAQYDFFYAGEGKVENMYIVRNGKIAWSYTDTATKGEISDAVLMTDGSVLFAHQFGITLINAEKKTLWQYQAAQGHEVHTAQPIGKSHVVFIENGDTARVIVMDIVTNQQVKTFDVPTGNPKSVHGQFRHARLTKKGTLLVAHMDMGKVCEYDFNGKLVSAINVPGVWGAEPLPNGNILTSGKGMVRELTPAGDTAWVLAVKDIGGYSLGSLQLAFKRPNGNIVINDWFNQWVGPVDSTRPPVQCIEVTPEKKVVWALREWKYPMNLGPATTIQFLDDKRISERVFFGPIK